MSRLGLGFGHAAPSGSPDPPASLVASAGSGGKVMVVVGSGCWVVTGWTRDVGWILGVVEWYDDCAGSFDTDLIVVEGFMVWAMIGDEVDAPDVPVMTLEPSGH